MIVGVFADSVETLVVDSPYSTLNTMHPTHSSRKDLGLVRRITKKGASKVDDNGGANPARPSCDGAGNKRGAP